MESRYLIDTNVLIDIQSGKIPKSGLDFMEKVVNTEFNISFISYIEFMGYKHLTPQSSAFLSMATILDINRATIDVCVVIRKSTRVQLPDAIIASTALSHGMILITHNVKDFANINHLKMLDPYLL